MRKIICLLMSLSLVAFASCSDDDRDTPSNASSTQTENGGSGDNSGNNGGGNSGSQSAVTVFKSGTENGHDYVDLGLTSGTKWATCNVGASNPQDYGNYYAWGETTTKETYDWSTYKYGTYDHDGDYSKLTKYNPSDSKTTLDLSDDAAYVNWGGKWRMPTEAQQDELINQCYWVWTESYNNSNVKGYIVYKAKTSSDKGVKIIYEGETTSSSYKLSDAHIFLPAAGWRFDVHFLGTGGYYWSSSLYNGLLRAWHGAWMILFELSEVNSYGGYNFGRHWGQSVRAVISGE
ncbi:MAG: hypothetical protein IJJ78_03045 [Paludibacteraceae bacterium]|nr:hypothetical protein [Paludibacteraceae bacterium]MBR0498042.1 hypothetical protein [Paludibacteraceae bacterium]